MVGGVQKCVISMKPFASGPGAGRRGVMKGVAGLSNELTK